MISNRNLGLTLAFEEVDYRLAVRNFISKYAAANYQEELTFICPGIDVTVITEIILQSERKWNFEFAEDSFQDVAIYFLSPSSKCISIYASIQATRHRTIARTYRI